MKKRLSLYVLLATLLCVSCSSPESEGKQVSKQLNECYEYLIESKQKAETDFVNHFNASDYSSRTEALNAYDQAVVKVLDDYHTRYDEVMVKKSNVAGKYSGDYKKLLAFETACQSNLDTELLDKVTGILADDDYPVAVLAQVKKVMPVKPDAMKMQDDLVGRELAEGFDREDCWFGENVKWKIKEGEIRDFQIKEVVKDNAQEYCVIATMLLQEEYAAYNATVKLFYRLPDDDDWRLEFVNSLGITIVKSGNYDDCLTYEIKDDGWGGLNALYIYNTCDIELAVAGYVYTKYDGKVKFAIRVSPKESGKAGGFMAGGSVTSFDIEFIERLE